MGCQLSLVFFPLFEQKATSDHGLARVQNIFQQQIQNQHSPVILYFTFNNAKH